MDNLEEFNNRLIYSFVDFIKQRLGFIQSVYFRLNKNFLMNIWRYIESSIYYMIRLEYVDNNGNPKLIEEIRIESLDCDNFKTFLARAYNIMDTYKEEEKDD